MPSKKDTEQQQPITFQDNADYLKWLNESPRIIKDNADGSQYVPISCVQEDLFCGFLGNTKFELLRENLHGKGLSGIGRLHYKHPISGEWLFQDGSAAIPYLSGLHLDFPSLSARVLLSCAKKIGIRFGQMLNRDMEDAPTNFIDEATSSDYTPQEQKILSLISESKTMPELAAHKKNVGKKLLPAYMKKLKSLT